MIQILIDLDSRVDRLASQLEESEVSTEQIVQMLDALDKSDSPPGVCVSGLLTIFIIQ